MKSVIIAILGIFVLNLFCISANDENRFSHALLVYPKGKYEEINKVIILQSNNIYLGNERFLWERKRRMEGNYSWRERRDLLTIVDLYWERFR